ncbi:MAG: hypothetical protein L6Q74_05115 [Sphaerotilus natans subsp. sulfidivorans]|uniref:hypothetical protein n=1 Tax=Sphaerotilus sulfidivorans TaxID=639200 RepID=UPI0023567D30|nr:hypothetical protein [Sphaerotilus sulfidivorans]MCK6401280.1 hypothetical protein [Sphaerotilus sulfidivorans]
MTTPDDRYKAAPETLAHDAITFLLANPDEELTHNDMAIKFDAPTNLVADRLYRACRCGALVLKHGRYRLGNADIAARVIAPLPSPFLPPARSIDDVSGEQWNHAAEAVRGNMPESVTLPNGIVAHIEDVPYKQPRKSTGKLDGLLDALAACTPAPGRTSRALIPREMEMTPQNASRALRRWHTRRGYSTRVVELVRLTAGGKTITALQRVSTAA